ncbi:MAG: hypothetical protein ABSB80_09755 [Methanoregula sp.]|uniref:hypothetical protein n=1 Tax=Methanoregula sp. TaxID=2052170 RepID=UPI003D11EDAD
MLESSGMVRRRALIKKLTELHPDERGYTIPTINRQIAHLRKRGLILAIKNDQFADYGIEDPDENAVYLVLKKADERREFIDSILPLLELKDEGDIIATLDEIDRYRGEYHLNSNQLNQVISALKSKNVKIVEKTLWIFYYYMSTLNVNPSDIDLLKESLKKVLFRFCRDKIVSPNIHHGALVLLGILKDPAVVDQLMFDAQNLERLTQVSGRYHEPLLAAAIEAQRAPLFEFERKLRKTKSDKSVENSKIADLISEIRSQAAFRVLSSPDEKWGPLV